MAGNPVKRMGYEAHGMERARSKVAESGGRLAKLHPVVTQAEPEANATGPVLLATAGRPLARRRRDTS
jgi:hypothetical protein